MKLFLELNNAADQDVVMDTIDACLPLSFKGSISEDRMASGKSGTIHRHRHNGKVWQLNGRFFGEVEMGRNLTKEIEALMKSEGELTALGTESLTEKQSVRLSRVRAELDRIDASNPGIIEHVRKDIAQGLALLGKKNYQQGLSLVRNKLFPLATRTAAGLVVKGADIAKLNSAGAAIGDHTVISLEQNKLCNRANNGDLVLPWEWDI